MSQEVLAEDFERKEYIGEDMVVILTKIIVLSI